jgi:predicted metal-binding membrane protein
VFRLGRSALGADLAWAGAGRWVAAGVVALAALYELTPLKHRCLAKCRTPLGFLMGTWREGWRGSIEMGAKHAAWCLGCCWALMAALFALGVMSLTWMVFVAALITFEKTVPWRRVAIWATLVVLLALAVAMAAAPRDIPGLVVPGGGHATSAMHSMSTMQ